MGQITDGVRSVLSCPMLYDGLQRLMGAKAGRQELVSRFIRPGEGSRILDVGCGTAEILSYLPIGVKYFGYDVSAEYVEAAKRRFGARGEFRCSSIEGEKLKLLPQFDIVLAIGVLHHLDDAEAIKLFEVAHQALRGKGRFVAIDPCLADDQNSIARLLIRLDRGQNVRSAQGYEAIAREIFPKVEGTLLHRRMIPYTHWIMECSPC
ncbi:demethylmenaquinone methyltransferase / 2-methoxy-6-polyprenyl-1,4-benzoquinol methylase [Burkholderiales bacterium]|nr:demethylmenaquinone methyltransferase / 2-methoxy-6-polyprenyl-1,4-benzoquinol methylase [Burkholderiales bacterium]